MAEPAARAEHQDLPDGPRERGPAPDAETVIEIKKLVTHYGARQILFDVNLNVRQGEIVVIMGGSGSGKSTLLNTLLGLLRPTSGLVEILGQDLHHITDLERTRLRQKLG